MLCPSVIASAITSFGHGAKVTQESTISLVEIRWAETSGSGSPVLFVGTASF